MHARITASMRAIPVQLLLASAVALSLPGCPRSDIRPGPTVNQRQAMSDLSSIARALDLYGAARNEYPFSPPCRAWQDARGVFPPPAWPPTRPVSELRPILQPFLRSVPVVDPWGHQYRWGFSPDGCHYTVLSSGRDGRVDANYSRIAPASDEGHDLIVSDSIFVSFPEGAGCGI